MRYYAHFGHKDFILCLGYRGDLIREYFLSYQECMSNDFVLSEGGRKIELLESDIQDWRITFIDTGMHSNIGQRLLRAREYVAGDAEFLANYADALSDVPLDALIADFRAKGSVGSFASVKSPQSFHRVTTSADGYVEGIGPITGDLRINGGFFAFRQEVFDYIKEGEELVEQPFSRLLQQRRLTAYKHDGFWMPMDTFKDKITYDRMAAREDSPWMLWRKGRNGSQGGGSGGGK